MRRGDRLVVGVTGLLICSWFIGIAVGAAVAR